MVLVIISYPFVKCVVLVYWMAEPVKIRESVSGHVRSITAIVSLTTSYVHVTFTPLSSHLRSVTHCRFPITVLYISVLGSEDLFTSRGHRRLTINSYGIMTKRWISHPFGGDATFIETFNALTKNANSIVPSVENVKYLVKTFVNALLASCCRTSLWCRHKDRKH